MFLSQVLIALGATIGAAQANPLLSPRQTNTTCNAASPSHNFTLTVDLPGFAIDGSEAGYANAGIFTNVSTSSVEYTKTIYYKNENDTGTLFANFPGGEGYQARGWQFSVWNTTSLNNYPGLAELSLDQLYAPASYLRSFFVTGDDEANPWDTNPHIAFIPEDGIGKGGFWACPGWGTGGYEWRIVGGVAGFNGSQPAYPVPKNCTFIGNLKVNLIPEDYGC